MELKIGFVGFGAVARAFARLLAARRSELFAQHGIRWRAVALATANHGCILSTSEIDLEEAARCIEDGHSVAGLWRTYDAVDSMSVIDSCDADLVFETTPLNAINGEPATTHIRRLLGRSISVVTANKGPLAFAFHELRALGIHWGVNFRFEGTVMDGAPVFNLAEYCLPAAHITGFYGILNSTSNYVLTEMEGGRSFEDALRETARMGIAEADSGHDIDGWDAAVKTVALANVLMGSDARPREVERRGVRNITQGDIQAAARAGRVVRLVAKAKTLPHQLRLSVAPEVVPAASSLGATRGTSNILVLETDLMGEIAVTENNPGPEQTAYALLSDMVRVHEEMLRGRRGRRQTSGTNRRIR